MRNIKIKNWAAKDKDGVEVKESLVEMLSVMIAMKKPEDMPRGLDNFRLMGRLAKAFDKAKENKILILEETDYKFLNDSIFKEIPSVWGTNHNMMEAVESFVNAKQE